MEAIGGDKAVSEGGEDVGRERASLWSFVRGWSA